MKKIWNLRKNPLLTISLTYFIVIISYLVHSNSRNALAEAKSSHLSTNLNAKILLIILAFFITVTLIGWISGKDFQKIIPSNKTWLQFTPVTFYILFNAVPAIIQSRKNIPIFNFYYTIMQVGNTFPNFIDLKQTVGFLIHDSVKNIGDEGLIYPTFILKLRFLNPFLESNFALNLIAYLTIVFFAWMILDFSRKLSDTQNVALTLLVVSPPFLLLIDRQNIDCLLILLLYVSASLYGKTNVKSIFAIILILMASLIKIYPIVILVFIATTDNKRLIKLSSAMAVLTACLVLMPDLVSIQHLQVKDIAGSAGLPVLMAHLAGSTSTGFYLSQTFILFSVLLILIHFYFKDSIKVVWKPNDRRIIFVCFGALILVETLILSTNYLYRMSYILFLIPLIGNLPRKSFSNASFLFMIFGIYLSPRSTGLLMNLFLFPFLILLFLFVLKTMNSYSFKIDFTRNRISNKTNN